MIFDNNICVGAGLISLDVLIWDGQRVPISYYVGGTCGNVMMILAHMGWEAFPIARLDGTKDGVRVLEDMKRHNVHTDFVSTQDGKTPVIVQRNFIYEGKNMLIEEFGRDYGRYFDILKLIATGHNTRGDIEGILHAEVSGYMTRLENDYGLIAKNKPMFQKSANKNIVYAVNDLFLQFWFRFIYKYNYFIEANAYKKLAEIVARDYETYSGKVLEWYFKEVMKESERYTHIDSWWDRKGENEIDIIAADDLEKKVMFYEVKRQRDELDMKVLKDKVQRFMEATGMYGKYEVGIEGLCMEEM